jgi:hypothetical protein
MSDIGTILGALLGVGGAGGVAMIGSMVRAHQKGKLEDEGTLIERLNKDNESQIKQRKEMEAQRDAEQAGKQLWMDQAITYRLQLVSAPHPIKPKDNPKIWSGVSNDE